jgi:hypothetical protein
MAKDRSEAITHWKKVFAEQAASGQKVITFCQKAKISKWQYYYWKQCIRNISGEQKTGNSRQIPVRDFFEVRTPETGEKPIATADAVEISIGSVSLFYRSTTDRELFRTVVTVLLEVAR